METVDEEFLAAAKDFIDRQAKADKPFFCWFNSTRMHVFTHLKPESLGKTGKGIHADGMVEHDGHVGQLLQQLDDLSITKNTIVLYTTDNGAELALWPDGAMTMFHGEKGTTWEGGFRIPMMVRWPGVVKPGTQINDPVTLMDWMPTFAAAAGILTSQGDNIAGGKFDYVVNGNMIAGFGLVAWPVRYGVSGVKTFVVNRNGIVYEADLGEETEKTAADIRTFSPGDAWAIAED